MRNAEGMSGTGGEASNTSMISGANSPYQPTTEPVQSRSRLGGIRWDTDYLRSSVGILKILQLLFSLIAFIGIEAVMTCLPCSSIYFFEFISCSAFLSTCALLLIFSLNLNTKISHINWILMDLICVSACTLLFFLASAIMAALNHKSGAEITAMVFGFLATVAFGLNTALVVGDWRRHRELQPGTGPSAEYTRAPTTSRVESEVQ
ncbi:CKLF-like MARVEL transmembrane domain-containing protein 4 [Brienomyrus brachyistius]|uniref:CKLF-like MARVEL transmembrane domain-containing protein 4 n=1 Tax=Brienomyrus brachyistius TaxID=42636 RepID=UPI0020B188C9|nr:CKLF-like MARVEL transmembrane domain-containing protein 4 [Brienomyrus brachyistius]